MFKQPGDLEPLYDEIIRTAIFTVKPDNIATFLGQRITYNCKKEIGTNYNQRSGQERWLQKGNLSYMAPDQQV